MSAVILQLADGRLFEVPGASSGKWFQLRIACAGDQEEVFRFTASAVRAGRVVYRQDDKRPVPIDPAWRFLPPQRSDALTAGDRRFLQSLRIAAW